MQTHCRNHIIYDEPIQINDFQERNQLSASVEDGVLTAITNHPDEMPWYWWRSLQQGAFGDSLHMNRPGLFMLGCSCVGMLRCDLLGFERC